MLVSLASPTLAHQVVFTRYDTREPTSSQLRAYEAGEKLELARLLPVVDRVELQLQDGQTKRFASGKLSGSVTLAVDELGYLLRFDTGTYEHKSPMLLKKCRPIVFYAVKVRAGEKTRIMAQSVSVGRDC